MKKWYLSRTLWVNFFVAVGVFVNSQYGVEIPTEYYGIGIGIINTILRIITKEQLTT